MRAPCARTLDFGARGLGLGLIARTIAQELAFVSGKWAAFGQFSHHAPSALPVLGRGVVALDVIPQRIAGRQFRHEQAGDVLAIRWRTGASQVAQSKWHSAGPHHSERYSEC